MYNWISWICTHACVFVLVYSPVLMRARTLRFPCCTRIYSCIHARHCAEFYVYRSIYACTHRDPCTHVHLCMLVTCVCTYAHACVFACAYIIEYVCLWNRDVHGVHEENMCPNPRRKTFGYDARSHCAAVSHQILPGSKHRKCEGIWHMHMCPNPRKHTSRMYSMLVSVRQVFIFIFTRTHIAEHSLDK
jgi:hypothetical protein